MADTFNSKIVLADGTVLIDLTTDTVSEDKLAKGVTAHNKAGASIVGTNTFDSDTTDATVAVAEMLDGKTAYARGTKLTGTMPNNGSVTGTITTKAQEYTIPQGYHDGGGKVSIAKTEQDKIIATNIREGVTVLGVTGTMSGTEGARAESKTVTPTLTSQTILPGEGYNYISQVTVNAIPIAYAANSAGGKTVTIG